MRNCKIVFLSLLITGLINGYSQTGIRAGLNVSSNLEDGISPVIGWNLAGYVDLETYQPLSYRLELKCSRTGYTNSESTLVSSWYSSLPILLDIKNKSNQKYNIYIGIEPGLFITGHEIPIERMRSLKYIFNLNHKESFDKKILSRQYFNIDGVVGFKVDSKFDTYIFLNVGFISKDLSLSISMGI